MCSDGRVLIGKNKEGAQRSRSVVHRDNFYQAGRGAGRKTPPFFLFLEDLAPVSLICISWVCLLAHERSRLYFKGTVPSWSSQLFPAVCAEFGASRFWFFNVTFAVNPQPERGRAPKWNDLFLGNSAPVYPQAALA